MSLTREEAIELARQCARAMPESYYAEPFRPHEWVIYAIRLAATGKRYTGTGPSYPAFASAIAKARGGPPPQNHSIESNYAAYHDCGDPFCTHGLPKQCPGDGCSGCEECLKWDGSQSTSGAASGN